MTLYRIETNKKCIFCLDWVLEIGMPPFKPLVVQLQLDDKGDTDRHGHRIIGYLCNVCNCVWNGETEEMFRLMSKERKEQK